MQLTTSFSVVPHIAYPFGAPDFTVIREGVCIKLHETKVCRFEDLLPLKVKPALDNRWASESSNHTLSTELSLE